MPGRLATATENGTTYHPSPVQAAEPQRHSSLLGMVGSAIQQVQRDARHDTPKYCTGKPPLRTASATAKLSYQPTPIAKGGKRPPVGQAAAVVQKTAQYNPTPIPLLRQMHEQRKQDVDVASELEYDPLTNFSTSGLSENWSATRVTLGDVPKYEAAPKRKFEWIAESANKKMRGAPEDCDDSSSDDGIAAAFSDDDDEGTDATSRVEGRKMDEGASVDKKTNDSGGEAKKNDASSMEVSVVVKKVDIKAGTPVATSNGSDSLDRKPAFAVLQESLSTVVKSDAGSITIKEEVDTNCIKVPLNGMKKELCRGLQDKHISKTYVAKNSGKASDDKSSETSKTSGSDKKRTSSKKPSADKHSHRSSNSSGSAKYHSSVDKKHSQSSSLHSATTKAKSSGGTTHRHPSTTKHGSHSAAKHSSHSTDKSGSRLANQNGSRSADKNTSHSATKNGSHSADKNGKSSGSKSHSSSRKHHHSSNSGSSKENSSGKSKHSVTSVRSRTSSVASDSSKTRLGRHLCETQTNGKVLNRSLSNVDLFGDDSDSDSPVKLSGATGTTIEISDDSAIDDEVMLLSPERPAMEDFSEPEDIYDECLRIFNEPKSSHDSHSQATEGTNKVCMSSGFLIVRESTT